MTHEELEAAVAATFEGITLAPRDLYARLDTIMRAADAYAARIGAECYDHGYADGHVAAEREAEVLQQMADARELP